MKKLIFSIAVLAAAFAFAEEKDPAAPYVDYGKAMESTKEQPLLAVWQNENAEALAAATSEDALAAVVDSEESAKALLAKLAGAYQTDPIVATKVAAVTQWVMGEDPFFLWFWESFPSDGRKVWVKALMDTAEKNGDSYVRQQCLEQLRWCGCKCPCILRRLQQIKSGDSDKGVRDLAALAIAGIEGAEQ